MRLAIIGVLFSLALSAQTISLAQIELPGPEKTLAELWGAAAKNPKSADARIEVTSALLAANRLQQAEWAARESVELDPSSARAQFLLGWILAREYRDSAETLDLLHRSARSIPEAHLAAADVLARQGSVAEARAELDAYLACENAAHRKVAEAWLKLLAN